MTIRNLDEKTVRSFGDEWSRFDQTGMTLAEAEKVFNEYFSVFPWQLLPPNAEGFDMGCGSGRWARWVAPRIGKLHCIDPSAAINVAISNLNAFQNIEFHTASVDEPTLPPNSQDFGYSLGVLHHVPDTAAAIRSCVSFLKPRAPILFYLYYAFDNRPVWFRLVWRLSDYTRRIICRMPPTLKDLTTDTIAVGVYWPLSRLSKVLEKIGFDVSVIPLSYYRNHSIYTLRTDSRDRFGTPLEQRFTKQQLTEMLMAAGLRDIKFSDGAPFWCVVGFKKQ